MYSGEIGVSMAGRCDHWLVIVACSRLHLQLSRSAFVLVQNEMNVISSSHYHKSRTPGRALTTPCCPNCPVKAVSILEWDEDSRPLLCYVVLREVPTSASQGGNGVSWSLLPSLSLASISGDCLRRSWSCRQSPKDSPAGVGERRWHV